jgi:membrane protease YdiL (CAAX protease family)
MTTALKGIELLLLFVLLPVSLAFSYSWWLKLGLGLSGFVYVMWLLLRVYRIPFRPKGLAWKDFWYWIRFKFLLIVLVTTLFVYFSHPSDLFFVPLNKPGLFAVIVLVYTFLSVWPQEVIYRTFFVVRYADLFPSKGLLIFVNAILFSLAHVFFRSTLVLVLTFLGGLLFAWTFLRFRSTMLVSVEHALYGNWLFTVGMGQMLAFPGMESG